MMINEMKRNDVKLITISLGMYKFTLIKLLGNFPKSRVHLNQKLCDGFIFSHLKKKAGDVKIKSQIKVNSPQISTWLFHQTKNIASSLWLVPVAFLLANSMYMQTQLSNC